MEKETFFSDETINYRTPCDPEAGEKIQAGDVVSIDFDTGVITNETKQETYQALPFPDFIKEIMAKGGLMNSLKEK